MPPTVDLRSDTVTRPTPEMYRAIAEAELGDDVLGDDPTVQRLERKSAELLGKEAGLFVTSGSMANTIAINVAARPGDEVLLDWDSHSLRFETGASAVISGVQTRQFRSVRGVPAVDEIFACYRPATLNSPGTALVVLENTHNLAGGTVVPLSVMETLAKEMRALGVAVHLDGARLFNAVVASGVPAAEYAAQADTVTFALSKGLGCPVGSVLCSTREFVDRARRVRKMLGGGMRQAGILAACGIVALDSMIDRLADDHANARRLAEGLNSLPGIRVDMESVQTNMVYFETEGPAAEVVARLEEKGVLCYAFGANRIRMVTHKEVDAAAIDRAIEACRSATL